MIFREIDQKVMILNKEKIHTCYNDMFDIFVCL